MNVNIAQLNDSYRPIMDGVVATVENYARHLTDKVNNSTVVTPRFPDYQELETPFSVLRYKSIALRQMPPYRIGLPQFDRQFYKNMEMSKFNLLHTHCPWVSGKIALKVKKKFNVPVISTFHSKYKEDIRKMIPNETAINIGIRMMMKFYNQIDQVWVPSASTGKILEEYGYKGEYEVMRNGCDMLPCSGLEKAVMSKKIRKELNIDPDAMIYLFVGQHRWEKNVKVIINALQELHKRSFNFHMIFVGEGYASKEMKRMINQSGMQNKADFLGVIRDRRRLRSIYGAADLFLFPSIYDNAPIVVREAASAGVPSIMVEGSCSAEGVIDGKNGFLIEEDYISLTRKLLEIGKNKSKILKAGAGARESIYVSWSDVVDEVYDRYKQLLSEQSQFGYYYEKNPLKIAR